MTVSFKTAFPYLLKLRCVGLWYPKFPLPAKNMEAIIPVQLEDAKQGMDGFKI